MTFRLSQYTVVTDPAVDQVTGQAIRLMFSSRSAQYRVLGEREWQTLAQGGAEALPEAILQDLVANEFLVPDAEDELATVLGRNRAAAEDATVLYQVVQPTAACQKGCGYCSQVHTKQVLTLEHQELVVRRVRKRLEEGEYKHLKIAWFGSEPLLGLAAMRTLTPRLRAEAQEWGCNYSAKIVTNGMLLTPKTAKELVEEHAVDFLEITLDGVAQYHDVSRPTKGGAGTFDTIFKNVVALAKRDDIRPTISLRCNVSRRNVDGVTPLLQAIAREGIQGRVGFYVAPIHAWGNEADEDAVAADEFANLEIGWMVQMAELGFSVSAVPSRKPVVCLAAMPDGELTDAYGNLFKCTEVSYLEAYDERHEYALGSLESPRFADHRTRAHAWGEEIAARAYPCAECEMLPVCGGGCPKLWHEGKVPCPTAKHNIRERLWVDYALRRQRSQKASDRAEA